MKTLKVMFMGTPDIAADALFEIASDDAIDVVCAVSQPDRPKGRGHKLMPTPVKERAKQLGIPVFQPEKIKNGELFEVLERFSPDIIAVVAYGKILPGYVLDFPKYGCINMHASLLPKYRGAAPVQWSVINGDKYTGVTTMKMDEGLDTGDMLLSEKTGIGEYETSGELFLRISQMGAKILKKTLKNIDTISPVPQDNEKATYAPMLTKEMGLIDWNKNADEISKHICGMDPWPMAYTHYKGEAVKIIKAEKTKESINKTPGEIIRYEKGKGLLVQCAGGGIWIKMLQFPGGKKMYTDEYLLGHNIDTGEILV